MRRFFFTARWVAIFGLLVCLTVGLTGCNGLTLGSMQRSLGLGSSKALTIDEISPEDEFYIGRAVAARVLTLSAPLRDNGATQYVNRLGQALGLFAPGGSPYNGFTFILLDEQNPASFTAPGGFVFLTRGMLGHVWSESELAALLAHEIAHTQSRDPLKAISGTTLERAFARSHQQASASGEDLAGFFADAVNEICAALANSGSANENSAAKTAAAILTRAGYDPKAANTLAVRLKTESGRAASSAQSIAGAATHPGSGDLVSGGVKSNVSAVAETPERSRRFAAALGKYTRKGP